MASEAVATQKELLPAHMSDLGAEQFQCNYTVEGKPCNQILKHKTNAVRHVKEQHCVQMEDSTCECGYTSKRKYDMQRHIREKHLGESYACKCGFRGRNRSQAQKHAAVCDQATSSNNTENTEGMDVVNAALLPKAEKATSARKRLQENDGEWVPGSPDYVPVSKKVKSNSTAKGQPSGDQQIGAEEDPTEIILDIGDFANDDGDQNEDAEDDLQDAGVSDDLRAQSSGNGNPRRSLKASGQQSSLDWTDQAAGIVKRRRRGPARKLNKEVQTNICGHECPTCHNYVPVSRIKQGNVWILVLVDPNGDSDQPEDFNPNVILPGISNERLIEIEHLANRKQ